MTGFDGFSGPITRGSLRFVPMVDRRGIFAEAPLSIGAVLYPQNRTSPDQLRRRFPLHAWSLSY
jgi:hypothetical protein